jgi:dTDP-4-amino-4,6-dideoxygalactose transaminase
MIRLSKSCLSDAEKQAVLGVLDREFLGMGAEVREFEDSLAAFFGRPVVCVANGTAALQLALAAVGVGQGDEVLVPSFTYVASFQAISALGAIPVACDIDINSLQLDLQDAKSRMTARTRVIVPVHYSGDVGALDLIYAFARDHRLRVVEDAAHAFGSQYNGQLVGGQGDVACFSFDGIKNITSGEGGCIVTQDAEVILRVQDARLLGVERDTEKRFVGERSWRFDVTAQGWRYHMSNIMAAIGIEQLKRFPGMAAHRQQIAQQYDQQLAGHGSVKFFKRDYSQVVPHIYPVLINGKVRRDDVMAALLERGIQSGCHYQPNHLLSLYRQSGIRPLPVTERIAEQVLSLPLHPDVSSQDVDVVVSALKEICP